jgi:hypothetical protein
MTSVSMRAPTNRPWYRHRWPWLLMLGPAIVVMAGVVTTYLAVVSDDGLVADDYYKRGLAINRTLEREQRAQALGLVAIVDIDADGRARVALSSSVRELAAAPAALRLVLAHPTRGGLDRQADLLRGADGTYGGRVDRIPAGRWRVSVEAADWRLPAADVDGEVRAVRLGGVERRP